MYSDDHDGIGALTGSLGVASQATANRSARVFATERSAKAQLCAEDGSDPVAEDLEVTGAVELILHVSSDATDTDFTAKLTDVYPDGRAFNLLEGILRARYRKGLHQTRWLEPGRIYEVKIPLGATSNVFRRGHRIRLEVSSSNFPRFDRNLNVGGDNVRQAKWKVARNTVHHGSKLRPRLLLPIVSPYPRSPIMRRHMSTAKTTMLPATASQKPLATDAIRRRTTDLGRLVTHFLRQERAQSGRTPNVSFGWKADKAPSQKQHQAWIALEPPVGPGVPHCSGNCAAVGVSLK